MKAVGAVLITLILSAAVVIALMLRGPGWAWWFNPAALAVLIGTVGVVTLLLVPRSWWTS